MPRSASVSSGLAKGFLEFAVREGVNQTTLLNVAELSWTDLCDPDARIGLDQYQLLIKTAQELSDDRTLALRSAAAIDMSDLSIVGLIMNASATMGDAFKQLQRYSGLALETSSKTSGPAYELEANSTGLWAVERRHMPDDFPELTEMSFARLTCGPRRFLTQPHILEVHFAHSDPGHADVYKEVFACPVRFNRDRNAMRLHPDIASWPVANQPDYVLGILTDHADRMLEQMASRGSTSEDVTTYLVKVLHEGDVSAWRVAHAMGMSRQTLYRRLKDEKTSFRELVEALRESLARDYLVSKRLSVGETAYLLGYSDPAAFSRAFKRRTGQSPRDIA